MVTHAVDTTSFLNSEEGGASIDTRTPLALRIESIIGQGGFISGSMTNPEGTQSREVEFRLIRPISPAVSSIEVRLIDFPDKIYSLVPLRDGHGFMVFDKENRHRGIFIPMPKES